MKPGFLLCVALLLMSTAVSSAQTLPPTVDPGVQRDRLLERDSLPKTQSPALLRAIHCGKDQPSSGERFILKGVQLESAVATEGVDGKAHWQPHLGQEVTLERVCEIALSLAARHGSEASAVLPVQYIDGGVVQVVIRTD